MVRGLKDQVEEGSLHLPGGTLRGFEREGLLSKGQKAGTEEKKAKLRSHAAAARRDRKEAAEAQATWAELKEKLKDEGKLYHG